MIYKLLPKVGNDPQIVARIDDDNVCRLTCTETNPDYLQWLSEGNTPEPAEEQQ